MRGKEGGKGGRMRGSRRIRGDRRRRVELG